MTSKHLVIGLFEKDRRVQALLRTVLNLAGHTVVVDDSHDHTLPLFLQTALQALTPANEAAYDLLLVDIAPGELIGEALAALEQFTARGMIPLIVLTEADLHEIEMISPKLMVLPLFARDIPQIQELFVMLEAATGAPFPLSISILRAVRNWQRGRYQSIILSKQVWLDQRRAWLQQRLEWIDNRQTWLIQRLAWIDQQRQSYEPQHEWLTEQQARIEGQIEDGIQQRQGTLDQQVWINQRQKALDHLKQHLPFQVDEEIS